MSLSKLLSFVRRYDQNATVIFDREEPIGRPTDLVMPKRGRRSRKVVATRPPANQARPRFSNPRDESVAAPL